MRREDTDARGTREAQRLGDIVRTPRRGAHQAHRRSRREVGHLAHQPDIAGPDHDGDHRQSPRGQQLRLGRVERRRRDQVVVEAPEAIVELIQQGALGLDRLWKGFAELLRVIGSVGRCAFRDQHPHQRPRPLPLGGRRERRRGNLIGRETSLSGPANHLRHEACKSLISASLRRSGCDMCPGPMSTHDVAGIGQTLVDRADGVGVHSQCGTELPDRRQSITGLETARVDLVGDLPVDLGGDRDARVALNVQVAGTTAGRYRGIVRVRRDN